MRVMIVCGLLFIGLQYQLWFGRYSINELLRTQCLIQDQTRSNETILRMNHALISKIQQFQNNELDVIEKYARYHLGMISEGERFYFIPIENDMTP